MQGKLRQKGNIVNEERKNIKKAYETMQVEVIKEKTGQDIKNKNRKKDKVSKKQLNNQTKMVNNQEIRKEIEQQRKQKQDAIVKNKNEEKTGIKKKATVKVIAKWTTLVIALICAIIFFMMSPLFNLSQIQVINNDKINSDTIISLSGLKLGENIYKNRNKQIIKNIKQNAYIENVKIDRKIPNTILITIKERKATFLLEYANSYAYINNQGYILEITEEKLNLPILVGYVTNSEDIKEGRRLQEEDLEKLETVLKIMESANGNGISELITKINIQNKQNYTIELESEKKTVYLGDVSNLSNRMLYLKAVLEEEKGNEGEIFINMDLHKESVYFRKKE